VAFSVELGGQSLAAASLSVERAIGRPVTWRAQVHVPLDIDQTTTASGVAGTLGNESSRVSMFYDRRPVVEQAQVVGARWGKEGSQLVEIVAHATGPQQRSDIFKPRRRVHRVRNWRELVDRLDSVTMVSTGVRNQLERYRFPSGPHTSIIQDGQSDWEFLANVVSQFSHLEQEAALKRLALVGGNVRGETAGRWVLNWASGAGYEQSQDVDPRLEDVPGPPVSTRLKFGTAGHTSGYAHEFPTGQFPLSHQEWRDRPFDIYAWERWADHDVPLFVGPDRQFAWHVLDTLSDAGQHQRDVVNWTTELTVAPRTAVLQSPLPAAGHGAWCAHGRVASASPTEQWIKIRLHDFETNEDLVEARIMSPYSGTDNAKGLHLVPEVGTPVLVAWSGRLMDPLLLLGNIRDKPAAFEAPSLWLERTFTTQYAEIMCRSVGPVTVESDLQMAVQGKTDITSDAQMAVTADGCDVELRGGVFYTGKGM
jgi:hypothetical protein